MRPFKNARKVAASLSALVALALIIVLAAFLLKPAFAATQGRMDWAATLTNVEKATDTLAHLATGLALVAGGVWTYYTFIKGRVLTPRLEPCVSGRILHRGKTKFLLAKLTLRNPGATKVELDQKGTALVVYALPLNVDADASWKLVKACEVFVNHQWIEPGEAVEEPALVPLPAAEQAVFKLRLRVNSYSTTWETFCITEDAPDTAVAPDAAGGGDRSSKRKRSHE